MDNIFPWLKTLWKQNLDFKWLQDVRWKNCRAAPNAAYIPTTVEHCANVFTHGVLLSGCPSYLGQESPNYGSRQLIVVIPVVISWIYTTCLWIMAGKLEVLSHGAYWSNQVWVVPSVVGFFNLLERSNSFYQYLAALVYGSSLILIFTISTFFHSVFFCSQDTQLKELLHRCDRAMIYVFIAGSYYPWVTLRPCPADTWAGHLDWIIWVLAFLGILYQQAYHERYKKLETFFYCIMGVVPALTIVHNWSDYSGLHEIQLGGLIYFLGVVFFKSDGAIPFAHAIWHLFVAAAAGVHYNAIAHHLFPLTNATIEHTEL